MPKWQNWSGKVQAHPSALKFPRSEEDVQGIVRAAASGNETIRCAGTTHSHAPLVANDGIIMDLRGLAGVGEVDVTANTAWVGAGSKIHTLGPQLHQYNLALHNQGDIDEQAIAGATATGTHGTGRTLKNLSSAVVGARMVCSDGEVVVADPNNNPELWLASRLHLGAFGIITELKLQLRAAYRLAEQTWTVPLDEAMNQSEVLSQQHRHFEFFWYPQTDEANVKVIDETDAPAEYPLADEGRRCAWHYEVLPNHRPHKHTEMEYSVPLAAGPECMREIQHLLQNKFADVVWPVEYRTLAADDVWLSSAYGRDTVTISVHQDVRLDEAPYYQACEEIFLKHGGRPHWGKVHYLSGQQLAEQHTRWHEWWQQRDAHDPAGMFLNSHLTALRP